MNINFLIFILLSHYPHPPIKQFVDLYFRRPSQFNRATPLSDDDDRGWPTWPAATRRVSRPPAPAAGRRLPAVPPADPPSPADPAAVFRLWRFLQYTSSESR